MVEKVKQQVNAMKQPNDKRTEEHSLAPCAVHSSDFSFYEFLKSFSFKGKIIIFLIILIIIYGILEGAWNSGLSKKYFPIEYWFDEVEQRGVELRYYESIAFPDGYDNFQKNRNDWRNIQKSYSMFYNLLIDLGHEEEEAKRMATEFAKAGYEGADVKNMGPQEKEFIELKKEYENALNELAKAIKQKKKQKPPKWCRILQSFFGPHIRQLHK